MQIPPSPLAQPPASGAARILRGAPPPSAGARVLLCFAQPFGALSLLWQRAPVQSDRAVNYVAKVKQAFEDEPDTYRAFLDILQGYTQERKSSQDVNEEACRSRIGYCGLSFRAAGLAWQVSRLFKDHKELLAEFSHFLPDRLKLVSAAFPND